MTGGQRPTGILRQGAKPRPRHTPVIMIYVHIAVNSGPKIPPALKESVGFEKH